MSGGRPQVSAPAWGVFHVFMEGTTPAKHKFFVCLTVTGGSAVGVVINSRVNELGQGEALRPCYAPLMAAAHPFLSHDSWADCTRTFTLPLGALTDYRGSLTPDACRAVLEAVRLCPRLKPRTRAALLAVPVALPARVLSAFEDAAREAGQALGFSFAVEVTPRLDGWVTALAILPDAFYNFEAAQKIMEALREAARPFGLDLIVEADSDAHFGESGQG